ncbi:MAG: hypothetical protein BWK78_06965 [Thiotrichaceae bacterium IS1]|nr:MAG: hypothetical protein BWK78_06965 [Thiotrichaceae bacterium IS1]
MEDVNPPELAETQALVLYAEEPGSPSVFVVGVEGTTRDRTVRTADKNLPVAFLKQSSGHNCGQTSILMVMSFYKNVPPTVQGIKQVEDWLHNYSDTTINDLLTVAKKMGGFTNSYRTKGWGLEDLRKQIDQGNPVITAVISKYLSNRGYDWEKGHFVVVKGYTGTHMIVNDPGTRGGADKYYLNAEFQKAFAAWNGSGVVVVAGGLKLDSDITMTPNPAVQGQPVTITAKISNRDGTENFRGNLYAAFHPQGDAMVTLFEIKLTGKQLDKGQDDTYSFPDYGTTPVALNLAPGTYQLYIKGNDEHALTGPYKNPITVKVVSAGKATKAPGIVAPANSSQNNSADGVTFQWANNNDPATITSVFFSLRETDGDGSKTQGPVVGGTCKDRLLDGVKETYSSSACGTLKPNQWYKWAVYLTFNNGSVKQGLVGYFKTGSGSVTTTKVPTIVSPSNHSQDSSASGMTLQWSNNNDPAMISGVYLSLRETSGDNVENAGTMVGDCKDRLLVGITDTFNLLWGVKT